VILLWGFFGRYLHHFWEFSRENLTEMKVSISSQSPSHIVQGKCHKIQRCSKKWHFFVQVGSYFEKFFRIFNLLVNCHSKFFWYKNGMGVEGASRAFEPWKSGVKIFTNDGDPSKRKFRTLWGVYEGQKLRNTEISILAQNLLNLALFLKASQSYTSRIPFPDWIEKTKNRLPNSKDSVPKLKFLCYGVFGSGVILCVILSFWRYLHHFWEFLQEIWQEGRSWCYLKVLLRLC